MPPSTRSGPRSIHPDDLPAIAHEYGAALAEGRPWRYEFRLRGADGNYRWFASQGVPEPLAEAEAAGRPRQWFGSNLDIDDLKQAQQAQQTQERLLATILMSLPADVVTFAGEELRYTFFNEALQRRVQGRAVLGHPLDELFPEAAVQGYSALLRQVLRTGEPFRAPEAPTYVQDPRTGVREEMFLDLTYLPLRHGSEAPHGVLGFSVDVTERVRARQRAEGLQAELLAAAQRQVQEREAQRQQLHRFFMEAPAAVCFLHGPDLVYELVNPGYQELFPGRELMGRPLLAALPEIAGHAVYQTFRQVFDTGTTHQELGICVPLARPEDGQLEDRYFNYIQQARYDEHGQIDGVLVFAFEVTQQVVAQQRAEQLNHALAVANQQLTRTNVDLDNFIYTASHDLKAPISNIEGLLYLLQDELPPAVAQGANIGPALARMLDAVERFKRTIDHLTDVSKLQKEHAPATALVSLAAVVDDVRQDLLPLLQATGAKLVIDVTDFPPVQFPAKSLRSLVYNLVSNAVKYRSPDRPPRVDVRAHVRPGHTVLEVHDNGLGLAAHHLPKLFGMFQRFHDHVEGTGIGLYMVKRMVENAGGRIEVHSQLGAGTTFFIFLPHAADPGALPFPAFIPA